MKSWILIVSYQLKDIFFRWWEQPVSVLARVSIGTLIGLLAMVILIGLLAIEKSLRDRLERFGTELVVIREPFVSIPRSDVSPTRARSVVARDLLPHGTVAELFQIPLTGSLLGRENIPVFAYPERTIPDLAKLVQVTDRGRLFCDWLPEGVEVEVKVGNHRVGVSTGPFPDSLKAAGPSEMVLLSEHELDGLGLQGVSPLIVFKRNQDTVPLQRFVDALQEYYRIQKLTPVQIQSSLTITKELKTLNERQKQWRLGIAAIFALVLVPVLAAISLLEFQQNLYISALLRSMGATALQIFTRHLIENLILVNLSIVLSVCAVFAFYGPIFANLGFVAARMSPWDYGALLGNELRVVLLAANVGAILSTLPIAIALRKPVGKVLL